MAAPAPVPALLSFSRTPEEAATPDGLVKLDRNERVQPLPDWFVSRLQRAISNELLTRYPVVTDLYPELAEAVGVDQKHLLLTAGSDAAIKATYQAWVAPGDSVVMLDPSYAMYRVYAAMFQARPVPIQLDESLSIDPQALIAAIQPGVKLVLIANPNQPTGTSVGEDILIQATEKAAEVGALVAVDEAYYPFSGTTVIGRVADFENLLVFRTFSKAAGLAGLRVGFVCGSPDIVSNLAKVRSLAEVSSIAAVAVREILRNPTVVDDCVEQVTAGKQVLSARARALGLEPIPTSANFMLIRLGGLCQPGDMVASLRDLGFLVKGPFAFDAISDCIRVTLGPPEVMNKFCDALATAVRKMDEAGA